MSGSVAVAPLPMGLFQRPKLEDPAVINAVSGALAGGLTATFVCPLDVLKTRLQVSRLGNLQGGIVGGLTAIAKNEGIKGLYRGLTPTLVALLPNWAVYFTVYDRLKQSINTRRGAAGKSQGSPLVHMAAAAGAGAATLVVTNPLWVVKTRLQTQNLNLCLGGKLRYPQYRSTVDALYRISTEEGLRGLYSGLAPSMMGIFHVAIQFPLYEFAKSKAAERRGGRTDELTPSELVVTSALSKMVASTATYPHEVLRSYMHVTGSGPINGFFEAVRTIMQEDGIRGFYRGCGTNLLRTTPAAALTFTSFELVSRFLRRIAERPPTPECTPLSIESAQSPLALRDER